MPGQRDRLPAARGPRSASGMLTRQDRYAAVPNSPRRIPVAVVLCGAGSVAIREELELQRSDLRAQLARVLVEDGRSPADEAGPARSPPSRRTSEGMMEATVRIPRRLLVEMEDDPPCVACSAEQGRRADASSGQRVSADIPGVSGRDCTHVRTRAAASPRAAPCTRPRCGAALACVTPDRRPVDRAMRRAERDRACKLAFTGDSGAIELEQRLLLRTRITEPSGVPS